MFFFLHSSTSACYSLSLHDALPIYMRLAFIGEDLDQVRRLHARQLEHGEQSGTERGSHGHAQELGQLQREDIDRKSTRLNSSHRCISYAVFCVKKKKNLAGNIKELT